MFPDVYTLELARFLKYLVLISVLLIVDNRTDSNLSTKLPESPENITINKQHINKAAKLPSHEITFAKAFNINFFDTSTL